MTRPQTKILVDGGDPQETRLNSMNRTIGSMTAGILNLLEFKIG